MEMIAAIGKRSLGSEDPSYSIMEDDRQSL